jgi:4-hydroxy-tetrahydrodipicolinate synthase
MRSLVFRGTGTALVTPFRATDGAIDFVALHRIIARQLDAGIEALVPMGSTGEGATLSHEEKLSVIDFVVERAAGKAKVVAGTGLNDTIACAALTREASALGIDAVLVVSPYYNKPTQAGLLAHYSAVANSTDKPIILYNVPGRTASNMTAETTLRIADAIPSVVGIKEASGNMEQVMEIIRNRPEGFQVLSGEDTLALPTIAAGGDGVIAVISNEYPLVYGAMTRAALAGNLATAQKLHYRLWNVMRANFLEPNPTPVKAALASMELIEEALRLPLLPMSAAPRAALLAAVAEAGGDLL